MFFYQPQKHRPEGLEKSAKKQSLCQQDNALPNEFIED
jgi:hypothetical protein